VNEAEHVYEDIGKVFRKKPRTTSMQYVIQVPASLGRNPKFPFSHKEPVRIRIDGDRLVIEKVK